MATQFSSITHSNRSSDDIKAYTVCWLSDGRVATGGRGFLEIRNSELEVELKKSVNGYCKCIRLHPDNKLAVMIYRNNKLNLSVYSLDLTLEGTLLEMSSNGYHSHFCINSQRIVIADPKPKLLRVYDLNAQSIHTIDVGDMHQPWGVHILSDSQHVVVSDYNPSRDSIRKYKLSGDSTPVWSCKGNLRGPTGICQGQAGEVYVAAYNDSCIYQICSETGEI